MPDYRRKKRNHFSAKPKTDKLRYAEKKNKIKFDDEADAPKKKRKFNVLKGNKEEIRRRWQRLLVVAVAIVLIIVVCQITIPAGIPETVATMIKASGGGNYPIGFESSNTENVVAKSNFYYVLTNSEVQVVTSGGKVVCSYTHGFENPVIKTSKTRALVFNQGGTDALIFNLSDICANIQTEKEIITANIGEDGTYALVTAADSYVAAVNIYKKNGKLIYQWFSSSDMVNNVALSSNGKKVAVSTFSTNVSGFNSKLLILNFKSANAEFTKEYKGELVYNLSTTSSRGLWITTANTVDFVRWFNYESKGYKNEYNLQMMRESNNGVLLVYNRENDKTDNRIVFISNKGVVKHEFEFNGIITDIAFKNNHIYCVSDTKAFILDVDGKIVREADCGFGVVRLAVISKEEIAVVTDNGINKIKFE